VHPILLKIPNPFGNPLPLHSYGVLIVCGFLLAMFVAWREAKRQGELYEEVLDFAFWALLGGMLGARLVYILVNFSEYAKNPLKIVRFWEGGLVFYGAALGGLAAFLWYCWPTLRFADICVVGLPLAQAFGRLGCVSAGCCWGDAAFHFDDAGHAISDIPLAAMFPEGSLAYSSLISSSTGEIREVMRATGTTVPLIPIQLIESLGVGLIFLVLLVVRSRKWFHGQVLLTYGILYPVLRSINELFRGDAERGYVIDGVLSTSQFISLVVATASLVTIVIVRRRTALAPTPAPV
jgi:phosphatidylglycerol---prolipoprotein diacylglyceryl transferase